MSQAALPVFLERARAVLGAHAAAPAPNQDRLSLDLLLCCLDTLGAMTLAPAVTDTVLPTQSRVKACPLAHVFFRSLGFFNFQKNGVLGYWGFQGSGVLGAWNCCCAAWTRWAP